MKIEKFSILVPGTLLYHPQVPIRITGIQVLVSTVGAVITGFAIGNRLQIKSFPIPVRVFQTDTPIDIVTDICPPEKDIRISFDGPPGEVLLMLEMEELEDDCPYST